MAYRDDLTALSARHDALAGEVAQKSRELDESRRLLEQAQARARLPVLDNIRVAAPCTADWNQMAGDERARHCGDCKKDVFNLSGMTRDEAEALLIERAGNLCVRYYRRHDGTILLADCTIGVKRRRRRRLVAAGAALLASGAAAVGYQATRIAPEQMKYEPPVLGMIKPPPPPPPPTDRRYEVIMGAMAIPTHDDEHAADEDQADPPPPAPPAHLNRGQLHIDP